MLASKSADIYRSTSTVLHTVLLPRVIDYAVIVKQQYFLILAVMLYVSYYAISMIDIDILSSKEWQLVKLTPPN